MKEFKIMPHVTASGRIVAFASYSGYATIGDVVTRIKTDKGCIHRTRLLAAIEAGAYWESL